MAIWTSTWATGHVESLGQDFRLRARGAIAYHLRNFDKDAAIRSLAEACILVDGASTRERADHYRRCAYVLVEAGLADAARQAVRRAHELHTAGEAAGEPMDDRERDVWEVAVAEMYVEISVAYLGLGRSDYRRAFQAGQEALQSVPTRQAPRTFEALIVNLTGLIAQQRWQDLLWLELDVLWIGAYRSDGRMSRSSLAAVAQKARRAARRAQVDETAIDAFAKACQRQHPLSREVMAKLFGLRGLRDVKVWDLKL